MRTTMALGLAAVLVQATPLHASDTPAGSASATAGSDGSPLPSGSLDGSLGPVSALIPGPSPWFAGGAGMLMMSEALSAHNLDTSTWAVGHWALRVVGFMSVAAGLAQPFAKNADQVTATRSPTTTFMSRMYVLDTEKKSALTGSLRRQPKGRGTGWDFSWVRMLPANGFLFGWALTYQQTQIDSDRLASLYTMFGKVDLHVGWNLAHALGSALGSTWLARQQCEFRVGPSYFRNWATLTDEGSAINADRGDLVGERGTLVSAFGYELAAFAAIDFGIFGGLSGSFERGSYPAISFPEVNGNTAALLVMSNFDDLRQGSSYTWQRMRAELSVPLIGALRSATLDFSGSLSRIESSTGTSVNNRGFAIGSTWRF